MIKRGFRYQTGEIDEVAKLLKEGNIPEIDIDFEYEIQEVIGDLESFGFEVAWEDAYDYDAVDKIEHPDFMFRLKMVEKSTGKICYLDFYEGPKDQEDGYDEIWWG
ncbi:hypothetical protein Calkr_1132 [Caldicellulosiruptor acetigenus I77R1B]|uniref:Uncharacterized protein n=2 Tax=Caldicellulosiruptor acetigenus TaxID=301953 RepID=G2PYZ3_9FIRM|nr:hypothetical protein [Caldicellulosiruptor acetigenus]ADQ40640.1 hypothetical protein Calkr_1132 [Caldicellulosiruptor acetigenus I77R1B]AEM73214.1 hypothetical protein Calla_0560 [Caldicellulosiruptor acetigenus 6A]